MKVEVKFFTKAEQAEALEAYHAENPRYPWAEGPTRGKRLARVKAYLKSGKLPAAWMAPTKPFEGRAGLSEAEARRVVLPNFPKPTLKLLPGDLGVERAVGRYLEARGEREESPARAGGQRAGAWQNSEPARWSCGCAVWSDTRTRYTGQRVEAEFLAYEPARVEPCAKHRWALEGRPEAEEEPKRERAGA